MKPSSRDAIIEGIERAFVLAGAKDYDHAMATTGKIFDYFQRHYHPMRSRKDFAELLDSFPEPSWLRMRFILGTIQYSPQLVRFSLKRAAEMAEEDFPAIPAGRPGLDVFSKEQIIAHIGKKHIAGYTLEQAKKSAVRKYLVSESTAQRAWDDRANRGVVDFRSVLKYLEEDFKENSDVLDSMDKVER